jgi:hypothetical protein
MYVDVITPRGDVVAPHPAHIGSVNTIYIHADA